MLSFENFMLRTDNDTCIHDDYHLLFHNLMTCHIVDLVPADFFVSACFIKDLFLLLKNLEMSSI